MRKRNPTWIISKRLVTSASRRVGESCKEWVLNCSFDKLRVKVFFISPDCSVIFFSDSGHESAYLPHWSACNKVLTSTKDDYLLCRQNFCTERTKSYFNWRNIRIQSRKIACEKRYLFAYKCFYTIIKSFCLDELKEIW